MEAAAFAEADADTTSQGKGKCKGKGKRKALAEQDRNGGSAKRRSKANETPSISDMKGRKIRKSFDGVWYDGTITKVYAKDKQVCVVYADGDTEDIELAEVLTFLTEE